MQTLERHPRLFLVILSILFLLPGISDLPLLDRDEPRFARASIEMMDRNEWLVPYFNDAYRFDKPPLTYWWMRLHYSLFGTHEFAARLHSFFSALITALLLFQIARSFNYSKKRALLSAAIWLSTLQVFIHSRIAVADMLLIACLTLSFAALKELLYSERVYKKFSVWFYLLYLSMGLGFLAKGPIALIIPLLSSLFCLYFSRKLPNFQTRSLQLLKESPLGLTLFFALIGSWGIPALLATNGAYFDVGINQHVIKRGFTAFNDRLTIPLVYYLIVILIFFSPWVSALVPSLKRVYKELKERPEHTLTLAWIGVSFGLFSFYQTQLPHYILPAYPMLALIVGQYDFSLLKKKTLLSFWLHRVFFAILIVAAVCLTLGLIQSNFELAAIYCTAFLACFALAFFLSAELIKGNKLGHAFVCIFLASLSFFIFSKNLKEIHLSKRISMSIHQSVNFEPNYVAHKFIEPSLVWYLDAFCDFSDARISELHQNPTEDCTIILSRTWKIDDALIRQWLSSKKVAASFNQRDQIVKNFPSSSIEWVSGYNPGNGTWSEVAILYPIVEKTKSSKLH